MAQENDPLGLLAPKQENDPLGLLIPAQKAESVKKKEPINGGEEVSVKKSQTVSAPLSESGAKDSEPIGLPESYTNDRTNYKDLVGGQRYKLSRGGVPVTGYWDAENSVFVKDPIINLAPKEVPKGFIEEAASIIPSKKYESEEEVLARNFDISQRAKQEAATKANAVNFIADLPVVQQLNKLAEESANDPEAAKQFEELANQPIGEGDFKGIRFEKGTEQKVFQNLTPNLPYEEYKGDQLQPLPLKSWLPEGYKDAKTVGDLYRFAKDDTQYINDVIKETRQFDEILTNKLISNLPQEKQDELKGLPYNSDEVQKALVESGETENIIKAAGIGLTNKLDALISVGSNIGLNDQEAEQKIRRELAYDQLFRVKPKGMAAEIASSVGGMLPDLTAGAVASPLMVASMASTMPQDFIKQYYADAISNGETPKMSDAMKYAATSTATQMPLMLAAGVIGGKPIAIGNENLVNRAIQLISEVGQRGAKDAAVFGLGGHYLQNKVNEVYGVAKNDDYLKSAANMGIIGMLFGVKENIGKVFKESLPTNTRNEIDYIASYLPPEYTEQQVKQAVGKGMVTPSEGDATLKRMAAYRQIVAQLPTEITFKEAEKIYPLWEKKGELQKQRESATSEIRSVIDGQIEDIDKEILIEAGVPLSSSEKAEYNKLITAQAETKNVDKTRIEYLERRQESAKKKEDVNKNEARISSEIGGREEPVEAEPIKEGSSGEAEGGGVVQAPQEEVAVEPVKEEVKVDMGAQEPTETPAEEAAETPEEQKVEAEEGIEQHAPEAEKEGAPQAEQVTEEVVAPEPKPKKQKKESTKSEAGGLTFERRPTTMPDGEEGVELIIKSEDGTEKSGGKFYPEDTKEMERAERGHKLQAIKSSVKNAYAEFKAATDLDKMGAALDPEKHAEAMYKFHKQLVKAAKDYLAIGINDIKKFAREMGISVKNAVKAWDEANGHAKYGKEDLDYDMADIAKTAIRRGISVREKMKEYVAKRKSISEAIKAFVDDSEIKGNLSAGEIKQLIKRAANVTTDKQLDKFLDYAEKVVSDANYAESLDKLNSARKSAMKKRHNEKTGAVKRFLGQQIFDEDGNVLLDDVTFADYVEAVNALNQRIPDHSLMEAKDATGKTLAERVEEQAAASNPYNSMNTMEQLSKAWNRLDNKIDSIESYRSFARNVNKIRARLRELVDNGTITEEQYRDAVDQIYKLEDGKRVYEGKFADQINDLKDAQLADAQAKMRNVDDSGFNKIQKALWDEFKRNMKVNYEKVKKLDVGDLDKLNTVLDRMEAGFMPEYELRDISNKIETEGQGKKVAAQVSGISKRFKAMGDSFKKLLTMTNPARYEGELGIANDSSLWKYVTGRTQKALQAYTQSAHDLYQKWYNGLPSFYKITSKKPIVIDRYGYEGKKAGKFVTNKREYDMTKAGIVRHMINHAAEMEAKGEKPVDFFGEQLESAKDRQAYENNDQLSILEDVYRKLKSDKSLLDDEGNLDYTKVKESVDNNDGRVLDKDQAHLEKLFGEIDKDTGEMISSANALRGVNATDNPTHIKRIYLGDRIKEGKISEGEQVGVRAGSSYERVIDKPKGAMELNLENVVQRQIRDAAKDYHLNEELDRQKFVFDDARKAAKEDDLNTLDILQNDQRDLMKYHLTTELPPWWNKLQGGLYAKLLLTPYRMVAEAVSNTAQMFLRGKSLRGLLTALPSEKINPAFKQMTDVMRATGSTALDHAEFRSMGNLELKDGKINRESLLKRGVEVINGVTNAMGIGGIWMPNFLREFEKITGEKFNYQKHMVDEKDSYLDAAKEASMYADREAETVVGSTVKGGGRRVVEVLPGVGLKADRVDGAIAKFLSEYPYRDTKELIRGIKQMATNSNEGRMDGLARAMGVVTNMMLYSGIYAITKAVWNSNFGDDRSKKEAEKTIKELSTKEGMIDFAKNEAIANAAATAGSRYSQAGKLITQIGLTALYNSDILDDKEKKNLSDFTEAQMFFKIPKIKTGKSAYERNQIGQLALRMIPLMNEAVDIVTKELGGEEGIVAFMKEIKDTPIEKMTTDQKAKLSLIKNFVNSVNLILMTQGTQLPFSKDFVKALDAQIKELK